MIEARAFVCGICGRVMCRYYSFDVIVCHQNVYSIVFALSNSLYLSLSLSQSLRRIIENYKRNHNHNSSRTFIYNVCFDVRWLIYRLNTIARRRFNKNFYSFVEKKTLANLDLKYHIPKWTNYRILSWEFSNGTPWRCFWIREIVS